MEQGTYSERSTPSSDRSGTPLPPLIIEPYNTKERQAEEDRFYDELVRDMHVKYMRYYLEKQERAKALEMKNKEISEEQVEGANESQFEPVGDEENEIDDEESLGDSHNEEIVDEQGKAITEREEVADLETGGESDNEEADDTESEEDKEESADTENDRDDQEWTSSEFGFGGITNIPVQVMVHRDQESDDQESDDEDAEDADDSEDSEAAVDEGSKHEDTQDNGVIEEPVFSGHSPTDARVQREDSLVGEQKTRMDKGRSEEFSNEVSRKFNVSLDSDEDNEIRDIEGHNEDDKIHDKNIDIDNEDTVDDEADEEDHEPRIERHTRHILEKEAAASKKSTFEPELEQMRTPRYSSRPSLFSVIQKERNQKRITHEDRRRERYDSFSRISDVAGDDAVRNNTPELFLGQDFSYASDINNISRRKRRVPSVIEGRETKRLKTLAPFTTRWQNKNFFIGEQVVYSLCRCEDHVCNYSKKND